MAPLADVRRYRASRGNGRPGVSRLWLGGIVRLICNFSLTVAALAYCWYFKQPTFLLFSKCLPRHYHLTEITQYHMWIKPFLPLQRRLLVLLFSAVWVEPVCKVGCGQRVIWCRNARLIQALHRWWDCCVLGSPGTAYHSLWGEKKYST